MEKPTQKYWQLRLQGCKAALAQNNFEAFIAQTPADAAQIVITQLLPQMNVKSVSRGDSLTVDESGVLEYFKKSRIPRAASRSS